MPFDLPAFVTLRPYLCHVTRPENLPSLRADPVLRPAAVLSPAHARRRTAPRPDAVPVRFRGRTVLLNDQKPLRPARMRFAPEGEWDLPRWLAHLDQRVFFWPLDRRGRPSAAGARHLRTYLAIGGVVLVLPAAVLADTRPPEFSRCNSGATSRYAVVERGADTFRPAAEFDRPAAAVVEVTVAGPVPLPEPWAEPAPGVVACGGGDTPAVAATLMAWLRTPRTAPARRRSGTRPAG